MEDIPFDSSEITQICDDIQNNLDDIMNKFYDRDISNVKVTISFSRGKFGRDVIFVPRLVQRNRGGWMVKSQQESHICTEQIPL